MKWIAISGTWRISSPKLEEDVRKAVREIVNRGDGIVTGGALNVDYIATDEASKLDPKAQRIKIFLPTTLKIYAEHFRKRAAEGVITKAQAEELIEQLQRLYDINRSALIENKNNKIVNKEAYFERNSRVIEAADELIAFSINDSEGVKDTINKAKKKGIPIKVFNYKI